MSSILGEQATLLQQTFAGGWMFVVVLVWDYWLISCIAQPRFRQRLQQYLHWIERVSGVVFMGLATLLVAR